MHLVLWERVCLRKEEGGLSIRSAKLQNEAFMMKLAWGWIKKRDTLWVRFMREKYSCGNDVLPKVGHKRMESRAWKGIKACSEKVMSGIRWLVGNGRSILFWKDNWCPSFPKLSEQALNQLSQEQSDLKVSDFLDDQGGWRTDLLRQVLPENVIRSVLRVDVDTASEDTPVWNETSSGEFSTRTAYGSVVTKGENSLKSLCRKIWRLKVPQRCRAFLWLGAQNKLLTNEVRHQRGMSLSPNCSVCLGCPENILHILRDCGVSTGVLWSKFLPSFFTPDLCAHFMEL